MRKSITVDNIDVGLLRKQINTLGKLLYFNGVSDSTLSDMGLLTNDNCLEGILNILETMLDIAENSKPGISRSNMFCCKNCNETYPVYEILEHENPFDSTDIIYGCPKCGSINSQIKVNIKS